MPAASDLNRPPANKDPRSMTCLLITSNWPDRIFKEWMPGSGYEEAHKYLIECYGPKFKGPDDPESELVIRVPVRRKE